MPRILGVPRTPRRSAPNPPIDSPAMASALVGSTAARTSAASAGTSSRIQPALSPPGPATYPLPWPHSPSDGIARASGGISPLSMSSCAVRCAAPRYAHAQWLAYTPCSRMTSGSGDPVPRRRRPERAVGPPAEGGAVHRDVAKPFDLEVGIGRLEREEAARHSKTSTPLALRPARRSSNARSTSSIGYVVVTSSSSRSVPAAYSANMRGKSRSGRHCP